MRLPSSWQEIMVLFGALQGLALCFALASKFGNKSPANRHLFWFVATLVFLLVSFIEGESHYWQVIKSGMGYVGDTVAFMYGPLLFLYTRKLLEDKRKKNEWHHFIPAMFFFIMNVVLKMIGDEHLGTQFNLILFMIISAVIFIQFYGYLFACLKLILAYRKSVLIELSYVPSVNYLLTIIGFMVICVTMFLIEFLGTVFDLQIKIAFMSYNVGWILISLVTYLFAFYAIIKPELFRVNSSVEMSKPHKLEEFELKRLGSELVDYMKTQKPYLEPELSLGSLAVQTGIRKEVLSRVINQGLSKNFYSFVNGYRVEEFKELVDQETNQHITHLGLAYEAGFKSKTTFYKAFKEITGSTPAQFNKS